MSFYDDASLVLIPSGIKASKVYSVKPEDGTGDLTFSRASTATRTNASGVIESVASNVPRLDYSGGATCPRLLLEGQRTNLALHSEEFNNAFWTKGNFSTISANATTSPDGTLSADKHVSANSTTPFALGCNASVVSGTAYTFSVYLKRSEVRFVQLRNNLNGNLLCNFDLELGVAGTPSAGLTASISNAGSGWYRCVITATSGATGTAVFAMNMANTLTDGVAPVYVGNGVNGYFAWGAQLEAGAYATSYIPTTTAAVTRLADVCNKTGISSLIGQTEGVLFWEGIVTQQTDVIAINRSTVNGAYITKGAGNLFRCSIYNSSNVITLNDTTVRTTNTKIALAYKSGDSALFVNGVKVATSASAITFNGALSEIRLNDNYLIASAPQSANQIITFNTRLTDAQCIELTTL